MMTSAPAGLRTLAEIRTTGLAALPPVIAAFLEGGSGSEITLRRNQAGFDDWLFSPRVMSGLPYPATNTKVLGIDLALPILTAPFGAEGYFHADGHLAVARSNERFGIASVVPEAGTFSLEDVAAASPAAAAVGQLHPMGSEASFLAIIKRYENAGYRALCLTLDCPTPGWREHNLVNAFNIHNRVVGGNYPPGAEIDMEQALGQLYAQERPVWSWDQLAQLMQQTDLPWMAKGILTVADAEAAIIAGASALVLSNHGGRQLDGAPSPIDVLPTIAAAVAGRAQILLDSGVRRGSDVVKAVALGADAVMIGRLTAYGLAAAGEAGADRVLALLKAEIENILVLLGRGSIHDLTSQAVTQARH
jgi:isopentenyl diphosphate isomerase/L-lactate dehydrogenase-like FMN-dependent dehydrogenase